MKRTRRMFLQTGVSGLVGVLAACGGSVTPPASPTREISAVPTTGTGASAVATTRPPAGSLTIYSGREKDLIEPLLAEFAKSSGLDIKTRYGDSAALAAALLEEGKNSPADLFLAQDAGALGAVSARGMFTPLPETLLRRVEARFRSTKGEWLGLSGRARVIVYNTKELAPTDLPASVAGLTEPRWKGRIGWAPTNASFQAFVTAMRLLEGEAATKQWLQDLKANGTRAYEKNGAIVEAVGKGELLVGLVNHYYLFGLLASQPNLAARNHYPRTGAGAIINVAGVGILTTSKNPEAAKAFVDAMSAPPAQQFFTDKTYEYPLIQGIKINDQLPPLADLKPPTLDLSQLADLETTLKLLTEVGIV